MHVGVKILKNTKTADLIMNDICFDLFAGKQLEFEKEV